MLDINDNYEKNEEDNEMDNFNDSDILIPSASIEEEREEINLRPKSFNEFIGQDRVKDNLKVYIESAKKRNSTLDHILFYGPPRSSVKLHFLIL